MAFWKKSEDPWDWDPSKKRPAPRPAEPKEPQANPLDSLKQWNEDRKSKAKEREEAKRLPPEKCPWCGKDMEQGFLTGGRDTVRWYPGIYKYEPLRRLDSTGGIEVEDEGSIWSGLYKTAWLCRECKKAVFDMPEPSNDADIFSTYAAMAADAAKKQQEEETSEE